jgi:hypothetical protein
MVKTSVVRFLISKGTISWFFNLFIKILFWLPIEPPVQSFGFLEPLLGVNFHMEFRVGMMQPCKTLLVDTHRLD